MESVIEKTVRPALIHKYPIEIFGRKYILRSDREESYAKELAALIDHKMRTLAVNTRGGDLAKLAIFTAINLADELYTLRKEQAADEVLLCQKTSELIEQIEDQLEVL